MINLNTIFLFSAKSNRYSLFSLKRCIGKEAQARLSAVIDQREEERERMRIAVFVTKTYARSHSK